MVEKYQNHCWQECNGAVGSSTTSYIPDLPEYLASGNCLHSSLSGLQRVAVKAINWSRLLMAFTTTFRPLEFHREAKAFISRLNIHRTHQTTVTLFHLFATTSSISYKVTICLQGRLGDYPECEERIQRYYLTKR